MYSPILFINKKTEPLDIEILHFQEQDKVAGIFNLF